MLRSPFVMLSAAKHPWPRVTDSSLAARNDKGAARNDKRWRGIGSALAALLLLSACGGTAAPAPARSAAAPATAAGASGGSAAARTQGPSVTYKFASSATETDISGEVYKYWANLVDQRTAGRVKCQFFWAGSLLTSQRMFDGLRDGLSDFGGAATASWSGQVPDVAPFEVPFAYPLESDLTIQLFGELTPIFGDIYKAYNQQLIWMSPHTVADPVSCKGKFLDSAAAWKGALVRTAGKWQGRTLELWGGKTVTIDSSEAYSAIQRGTADCLLYAYNLYDSGKMYEVAKYITRIDHSVNLQSISANQAAWSKLPAEDQKILIDAGRETQQYTLKLRDPLVPQVLDHAKQNGVKMCTPNQQEFQRLRAATDAVMGEIAPQQTDKGRQMQDILKKYRGMVKTIGPTQGDTTPCAGV